MPLPIRVTATLLCFCALLPAAGVTARWEPANPSIGPFPSDALTVRDAAQKTGRRVNLPLPPDCTRAASACLETQALNQLDGFNVQARLRVRFSGPINPGTLRGGIWYVALDNLTNEEYGVTFTGQIIWINQVVYDPETFTVYAKPDTALDQHRRYAIVVTSAVRDTAGDPVSAEPAYAACPAAATPTVECGAANEVSRIASAALAPNRIVASSVYTTLSATAWTEAARDNLMLVPPQYERLGTYNLAELRSVVFRQQTRVNPDRFNDVPVPFGLLTGIGRVAFGSFRSPRYINDANIIPTTPSGQPVALPAPTDPSLEQIGVHALLPATPKPARGYPVVIFGHGLGSHRFESPTAAASTFAAGGFATLGINAFGHGYGPRSSVQLTDVSGNTRELSAGGRGVPSAIDGSISAIEGCIVLAPIPTGLRDCLRQTALDLSQLARAIRSGIDLDGDGTTDLDGDRIYYIGHSLGALYGTLVSAIEPSIQASALNSGGGTVADLARWSASFRPINLVYFTVRQPPVINLRGDYNENYPLRYQPVRVNDVPGAIAIQEVLETQEWLTATGDPFTFATHLASSTLPGVQIKPVLWQYGIGDTTVPNPAQTGLVRAANMRPTTWVYRHDLGRRALPTLDRNPHSMLLNVLSPAGLPLALAMQQQAAIFFASGGMLIRDPNEFLPAALRDLKLFENPSFLTEDLNFLQ